MFVYMRDGSVQTIAKVTLVKLNRTFLMLYDGESEAARFRRADVFYCSPVQACSSPC